MMKTYHVTSDLAGMSRKRKTLRVLLAAGLSAAIELILDRLWPSQSPGYLFWDLINSVITGVIFGLLMAVFIKRNLNYKVVVSDNSITAVHAWFVRSVQKGDVKTVAETDGNALVAPALRVSEYGRFGTWLWGGVWIPKALHNYESIRDLALRWKSQSTHFGGRLTD